jgi:anti-anti-sigma factor
MRFDEFSVRADREDDIYTVCPRGELDVATAAELEAELRRAEDSDAAVIVLDLSDLEFISTAGLRLVLQAHQRSQEDSGRLCLVRPRPQILRAFEISGLSERLNLGDA